MVTHEVHLYISLPEVCDSVCTNTKKITIQPLPLLFERGKINHFSPTECLSYYV